MSKHYQISVRNLNVEFDCNSEEKAKQQLWDCVLKNATYFKVTHNIPLYFSGFVEVRAQTEEEAKQIIYQRLGEFADTMKVETPKEKGE
jgi:hypothetical protein